MLSEFEKEVLLLVHGSHQYVLQVDFYSQVRHIVDKMSDISDSEWHASQSLHLGHLACCK